MPRRRTIAAASPDQSLLDVLDTVLDKGAVVDGDLVLGVANVDLIYVRLSALLSALDRVLDVPPADERRKRRPAVPRRRRRR